MILTVGAVGLIGLLGLWGFDALLALFQRHKWWLAAYITAIVGLAWFLAFVWAMATFLWNQRRRPKR